MMRCLTAFGKTAAITLLAGLFCVSASADVFMTIDGEPVEFYDASPSIIDGSTYLPLRTVFEALGAYVEWDGETKTVYAQRRTASIVMSVGSTSYSINGEEKQLSAPLIISNGRTLAPVRAVGDALGCKVEWDADTRTVSLIRPDSEHDFADVYIDFWGKDDNGSVVLTGRAAYPEIENVGGDSVASAFNDYMASQTEQLCDSILLNEMGGAEKNMSPAMFERRFDIAYDKNGIISVLCYDSLFDGGSYPTKTLSAVCFDLNNGKILSAEDVLGKNFATVKSEITAMFFEKIDSSPDKYFSDAKEQLADAVTAKEWYIAEDGVHFFVNPGVISPPDDGAYEVILKK